VQRDGLPARAAAAQRQLIGGAEMQEFKSLVETTEKNGYF
jgi:hypothetical protein